VVIGNAEIPTVTEHASAIGRMLAEAQAELDRVEPRDLAEEVDAGAVVIDIRPAAARASDGLLAGALVIERTHLEWRLDPTSAHCIDIASIDLRVIIVCNEGYSSSLAAQSLRRLGLSRATDLVGGYVAWRSFNEGAVSGP